ncbi:two-component regulator propeller domain-containing protein, partial [Gemmatimonadota bacterium]
MKPKLSVALLTLLLMFLPRVCAYGADWVAYDTLDGLANNYVIAIAPDAQGKIWFGTENGVSSFDGTDWITYDTLDGLASNNVHAIASDSLDNLWFGTFGNAGVSKFDGTTWTTYDTLDGLAFNDVLSVATDSLDHLWFGTFGNGVTRFDGTSWTTYTTASTLGDLPDGFIYDIAIGFDGEIWFGTGNGVCLWAALTGTPFDTSDGLSNNFVNAIDLDSQGNVWVGTYGGGVSKFDGTNWTTYDTLDGLLDNNVRAVATDYNDNIWFGTEEGVSRFDGTVWTNYDTSNGLSDNSVNAIAIDSQGDVWVGTHGGGVSMLAGEALGPEISLSDTSLNIGDVNVGSSGSGTFTIPNQGTADLVLSSIASDNSVFTVDPATATITPASSQVVTVTFSPTTAGSQNATITVNSNDSDEGTLLVAVSGYGLFHDPIPVESPFTNYTNGNYVEALAFEGNNILWAGGSGGVVRWDLTDGSYTKFNSSDGLVNNHVYSIAIDSQGNKWFGTYGGVSRFDGSNWTTYTTSDGLAPSGVRAIAIDSQGNKWFGTHGGGVSKFDGTNWTAYTTADGLAHNIVKAIEIDSQGNKWFGTYGGGVSRFDGTNWTTYTEADGLADNKVFAIALDSEGNKWFGTYGGVSVYDGSAWTTYTTADGLAINYVFSIAIDSDGRKWFGTGSGVSVYDGSNWTTYRTSDGLAHNNVGAIAIDPQGKKWFGTSGGVSKFDGSNWTNFTTSDGLVYNLTWAIATDSQGNKWFGTNGGVSKFDGSNWTTYTTADGLNDNNVWVIAIDPQGNKWFGAYNGVSMFDGTNWTTYTTSDGLVNNEVWAIAIDSQGNKWFGTRSGGVSKFDGSNWTNYTTTDGLVSNDINAIAIDSQGNKWFGTTGGVSKFDGSNWTNYTTTDGLASNYVEAIAIDSQGNKWFGTIGGVSKFDGTSWTTYTTSDGLASNIVLDIAIDSQDNIWFGTYGVSKFDGSNWTNFTTSDGLVSNSLRAIAIDSQGNKWFGTTGGVSMLPGAGALEPEISLSDTSLYIGDVNVGSSGSGTFTILNEGTADLVVSSIASVNPVFTVSPASATITPAGSQVVTVTFSPTAAGYQYADITIASNDSDEDTLVVSVSGNGVTSYVWTTYTSTDGLVNNTISSIAIDFEGNKWFGTGGGVSKFDGTNWSSYTTADGLASNSVYAIAIDSAGNKWFGTTGGGVSKFDGSNWTTYTTTDGLVYNDVRACATDSQSNLWFGTYGGVSKFDGTTWTTYTTSDGLAHADVQAITTDSQGNLWFGTLGGGISKFDGNVWTTYTTSDGLVHNYVVAIATDSQGNVWAGHYVPAGAEIGGVAKFDGNVWTTYTTSDGLAHNFVSAIAEDSKGNLWFGTYGGGVSKFDGTNWTTYNTSDGLVNNNVEAIAINSQVNKWFGTAAGVSVLAGGTGGLFIDTSSVKFSIQSFSQDGVPAADGFVQSSTGLDTVGRKVNWKVDFEVQNQILPSVDYTVEFPAGTVLFGSEIADSIVITYTDTVLPDTAEIIVDPSDVTVLTANDTLDYSATRVPAVKITDYNTFTTARLVSIKLLKGLYNPKVVTAANTAPIVNRQKRCVISFQHSSAPGSKFTNQTSFFFVNDLADSVLFNTTIAGFINGVIWPAVDSLVILDRFGNFVPDFLGYPEGIGDTLMISVAQGMGLFDLDPQGGLDFDPIAGGALSLSVDSTAVIVISASQEMDGSAYWPNMAWDDDNLVYNLQELSQGRDLFVTIIYLGGKPPHDWNTASAGVKFTAPSLMDSTVFTITLKGPNVAAGKVLDVAADNATILKRTVFDLILEKEIGALSLNAIPGPHYNGRPLSGGINLNLRNVFGDEMNGTIGVTTDTVMIYFKYKKAGEIDAEMTSMLQHGGQVNSHYTRPAARLIGAYTQNVQSGLKGSLVVGAPITNGQASLDVKYLGTTSHPNTDSINVIAYARKNPNVRDSVLITVEPSPPVVWDLDTFYVNLDLAIENNQVVEGAAIPVELPIFGLDTANNRVTNMNLADGGNFLDDLTINGTAVPAINFLINSRDPSSSTANTVTDSIKFDSLGVIGAARGTGYGTSTLADSSMIWDHTQARADSSIINIGGAGADPMGLRLLYQGRHKLSITWDPGTIGGYASSDFNQRWQDLALITLRRAASLDYVIDLNIPRQSTDAADAIVTRKVEFTLPYVNSIGPNLPDSIIYISFFNLPAGLGIPLGIVNDSVQLSTDNINWYPAVSVLQGGVGQEDSIAVVCPLLVDASTDDKRVYVRIHGFVNPDTPNFGVRVSTSATPIQVSESVDWAYLVPVSVSDISVPQQPGDVSGATVTRQVEFTLPVGHSIDPNTDEKWIFISFFDLPEGSGIPAGITNDSVQLSMDNINWYPAASVLQGGAGQEDSIAVWSSFRFDASSSESRVYLRISGFVNPSTTTIAFGVRVSTSATIIPAIETVSWSGGEVLFTNYTTATTTDGLANNIVSAIAIDSAGNKWFGTMGGVSRFDGIDWTTYTTADGLANNYVHAIATDSQGSLWFGTSGGVSQFDGTTWTTYTTTEGLAYQDVWAIATDFQGKLWFGTWGGGVSKFDGNLCTTYTTENSGLASDTVRAIATDTLGNLWFGTGEGVSRFDGTSWITYTTSTTSDGLASNNLQAIATDSQGNLWFGTHEGGVSRFNGSEWTTYTTSDGLASNTVWAIALDSLNNLWFGTWQGGVSKFDGTSWTTYNTSDGLVNNGVNTVATDSQGNMWFGTSGGVSMLPGGGGGITISGTVTWNNLPLGFSTSIKIREQGANAYTDPAIDSVQTNIDGTYSIQVNLPPGDYGIYSYIPSEHTDEYWLWAHEFFSVASGDTAQKIFNLNHSKYLTLLNPENSAYIDILRPVFTWAGFPGASSYYIYFLDEGSIGAPRSVEFSDNATVTDTTHQFDYNLKPGHQYEWYVSAAASDGTQLAYYGSFYFDIDSTAIAEAPINYLAVPDSLVPDTINPQVVTADIKDSSLVKKVQLRVFSTLLELQPEGMFWLAATTDTAMVDSLVLTTPLESVRFTGSIPAKTLPTLVEYELVVTDNLDSVTVFDRKSYIISPKRGKRNLSTDPTSVGDLMRIVYLFLQPVGIASGVIDYLGLDLDQDGDFSSVDIASTMDLINTNPDPVWSEPTLGTGTIYVGNAQAPAGAGDTIDVFINTEKDYYGADITLSYDPAKMSLCPYAWIMNTWSMNCSTCHSSPFALGEYANPVIMNPAAWDTTGGDVKVIVDSNTVRVVLFNFSTDPVIPQADSVKLFSLVMNAAPGLPAYDGDSIYVRGLFAEQEEDFTVTEELAVSYPGYFSVSEGVTYPPDTIFVKSDPATPGGELNMTFELHLHSSSLGGFVSCIQSLPVGLDTVAGSWYEWTPGFGQPLKDNSSYPTVIDMNIGGMICLTLLGVNLDQLVANEVIPSKSGELINFTFQVPDDMPLGVYELSPSEDGNIMFLWPITDGTVSDTPVVIIEPINIYFPYDEVFNLNAYADSMEVDTAGAQVDKIISFTTSGNGILSTNDYIEIYFDLPDLTYGIPQVALPEGVFTSCTWGTTSTDGDTFRLGVPFAVDSLTQVRIKLPIFINPPQQGYYTYGVRTSADTIWAMGQMAVNRYLYPIVLTQDSLRYVIYGNNDQVINPGEKINLLAEFTNMGLETTSFYAVLDTAFDQYVNPFPAFNDFFFWPREPTLAPDSTRQIIIQFWVSSHAPSGHELKLPVMLYKSGTSELVGLDTLRHVVTGSDTFSPSIVLPDSVGFVPVGQSLDILIRIYDGADIAAATATVRNQADSQVVATLDLYDDGSHGDNIAGDRYFSNTFIPTDTMDFWVDLYVEDEFGNSTQQLNMGRYTSKPFKVSSRLLLIDSNFYWFDQLSYQSYSEALDSLGYAYDFWDSRMRDSSMPDSNILTQYQDGLVVIYGYPGLDDWRKFSYMKDLNISLWAGSDGMAYPAGYNSGYASMLADYMGATYVQDNVGLNAVHGVSGDPVADGLSLDINIWYHDEMDPSGSGVTAMTYGSLAALASATEEEPVLDEEQLEERQKLIWRTRALAMEEAPEEVQEAYFREHDRETGEPLMLKTKGTSGPELAGIISSGSAAIRTETEGYKTFIMGFDFAAVNNSAARLDFADRVMTWLYPTGGTRVRNLDIYADSGYVDTMGVRLDKIVSFGTSYQGSLLAGDTVELFLDLPDGSGITYTEGLADSILVAVTDSIYSSSAWASLSPDGDTLHLGVPVYIESFKQVQIKLKSFINPSQLGSYTYGARTQADTLWAYGQMSLGGNSLTVTDATGEPGSDVTVKVLATVDENISVASFDVLFDTTKIQFQSITKGADATEMTIDHAFPPDTVGRLRTVLYDLGGNNHISAGLNREIAVITFTIADNAYGDVDVGLGYVEASYVGEEYLPIYLEFDNITGGTVTIIPVARVRNLEISAGSGYVDTMGVAVDKVVSFVTSGFGALAIGDTMELFFDLPDGSGITYTAGLADSILVAVTDSIFSTSAWASLSLDGDTLRLGVPGAVGLFELIQIKIPSFINPAQQGSYTYSVRTQTDTLWSIKQMAVKRYIYPLILTLDSLRYDDYGNYDKVVNPGERISLLVEFTNMSLETTSFYAVVDTAFDQYINPYPAANDFDLWPRGIITLPPDSSLYMDMYFWVSSHAPSGHELKLPVILYENVTGEIVGADTLRHEVYGSDTFSPSISMLSPGYVPAGNQASIQIKIYDGAEITTATGTVINMVDSSVYTTLTLYDDATHGDHITGDRWFSATFTPPDTADYWVDLYVEDEYGNSRTENKLMRFTSRPFEVKTPVLLIGVAGSSNPWVFSSIQGYAEILDNLGYNHDLWDGHLRGCYMPDSSILAQYEDNVVIMFGNGFEFDWRKLKYMQDLNINLWGVSEDIAENSRSDSYYASILSDYMGATFIQDIDRYDVNWLAGVFGDPVTDGLMIPVSGWDMDEMDPTGGGVTALTYEELPGLASAQEKEKNNLNNEELEHQQMVRVRLLEKLDNASEEIRQDFLKRYGRVIGESFILEDRIEENRKHKSDAELAG